MSPSINLPTSAPILSSVMLVAAIVMIVKIAVAMILARVVQRQARSVPTEAANIATPRRQNGRRIATTKHNTMPVKNRPNITCEATLRMRRYVTACAGIAMVAPASSSFKSIETGSNQ